MISLQPCSQPRCELCQCSGPLHQCPADLPGELHLVFAQQSHTWPQPHTGEVVQGNALFWLFFSFFFFARTRESFGALAGTAMLGKSQKSQFTMLLAGMAASRSLEQSPSLTGLSQLRRNRLPLNSLIPGSSGLWCFLTALGACVS